MQITIETTGKSFGREILDGFENLYFKDDGLEVILGEGSMYFPLNSVKRFVFDKKPIDYKQNEGKSLKIVPKDSKSLFINDYNSHYYWKNLLVIDKCRFVEIWNLDCIEYYSIKK